MTKNNKQIECCFNCVHAQSNEDGIHCYYNGRKKTTGNNNCEFHKFIKDDIAEVTSKNDNDKYINTNNNNFRGHRMRKLGFW